MSDITRDRIERALLEFTGFTGDQAVIDSLMVSIEAWAVKLSEELTASTPLVREAHVHLLVQQAELLLDSAGRLAQTAALSDNVVTIAADVMKLTSVVETLRHDLGAERVLRGIGDHVHNPLAVPEPVPVEELEAWLGGNLPDWERDLIQDKLNQRREEEQPVLSPEAVAEVTAVLPKRKHVKGEGKFQRSAPHHPQPPHRGPGGTLYLTCAGDCGLDLPVDRFFTNKKSPSGYENKCKACRKLKAA